MTVKYLDEYTKEELHNMTEEDKQRLFGMECAARGVALPSSLVEIPEDPADRPELAPDKTLYGVRFSSYGSTEMYYSTPEEAQAVAEKINENKVEVQSTYSSGKSRYYISDRDARTASVEAVNVFSEAKWSELKSEIQNYDNTKKKRQELIDQNNKLRKEHDEIWEDINKAVSEANYDFDTADKLSKQYSEYKKLADNDENTAKKFLVKAQYNTLCNLSDESLATVAGFTREEVQTIFEANEQPAKPVDTELEEPIDLEEVGF